MRDQTPAPSQPRPGRRLRHGVAGLLLGAVTLLALVAPAPIAAWTAGTFSSTSESLLVQLTNQSRANAGLKALTVDTTLRNFARSRSKDMIDRNYFSHNIPPDGHKVFDEMRAAGYCFVTAGENIGWNTYPDDSATQAIHDMFMGSSTHRSNILGTAWRVIGVGAYQGSTDKKMWTVLFAQPCSSATPRPATPRPATPKPATPKPATPKPATPRPATPRPATPPPAPAATAEPTPVPTAPPSLPPTPEPTPDLELERETFVPAWLWNLPPVSDETDETEASASTPSPSSPGGNPGTGLRVADPPVSQGLFETIVGGVAAIFFGS